MKDEQIVKITFVVDIRVKISLLDAIKLRIIGTNSKQWEKVFKKLERIK